MEKKHKQRNLGDLKEIMTEKERSRKVDKEKGKKYNKRWNLPEEYHGKKTKMRWNHRYYNENS